MKAWRFQLENSPKQINDKLQSGLNGHGGFVLTTNLEGDGAMTFSVRKRIFYAWYLAFQNWTVAKGAVLKNGPKNKTTVDISFNQHLFIRLIILTHSAVFLGFIAAILAKAPMHDFIYVVVAAMLTAAIVLGVAIQRKFERDVQKFKTLLMHIFEL